MEVIDEVDSRTKPSWLKKKYLLAETWSHCFVGSKESTVRWLLEIGVGVIAGQVLNGNRWEDMHRAEIADMQEEIDDNMIVDVWATEFEGEIVMVTDIPDWARDRETAGLVHASRSKQASETLRQLWAQQRSRRAFGTVLTLRLSNAEKTLVDWIVARTSGPLRKKNGFTQTHTGWSIERERAFDDTSRHRKHFSESPESRPVDQGGQV
ncbi:hypothetical protein [Ottowia sp.]|uniref:hypothetical protein n=1 Tax=Ottowia sp. TaxID=1898956 RepID=UPI0025CDE5DF|nr:hypothetical protein [Ottowia sp.]MBK6616458.1 hypothetical protein [Ottowia sp.]